MTNLNRTGTLQRSQLKRNRKRIPQKSPRSIKYEDFRSLKAIKDRDEEGLLHCEDWKIGLPRCGIALPVIDLHHIEGRDGELLFNEAKMVWLVRNCHSLAHETGAKLI